MENLSKEAIGPLGEGIRILHLSDMHMGAADQAGYWPGVKKAIFDDLTKQASASGGWDLVFFTGDLTQAGGREEYAKVTEFLTQLWAHLGSLGCRPKFLAIPGNHDLVRPDQRAPEAKLLSIYSSDPEVKKAFWESDYNYRSLVESAFQNFVDWWKGLEVAGIPLVSHIKGVLPGDLSATIQVGDYSLGIVALNSAWLHLRDGDLKGKLCVDVNQLHGVTNNQPNEWSGRHTFNLLLTHHPVDWLELQSRDVWRSDIYHPDWFDCHLFGHMHQQSVVTSSIWGAPGRRELQAPSLFSMELTPNGLGRLHGYSTLQLAIRGSNKVLRLWPRTVHKRGDGVIRLIPNHDIELGEKNWTEETFPRVGCNLEGASPTNIPVGTLGTAPEKNVLAFFRQRLASSPATKVIRPIERATGLAAIGEGGVLWVCSDWGMGSDEYVRSLQDTKSIDPDNTFVLDIRDLFSEEEILAGVQERAGCIFEQLCEAISLQPPCIVLFEDAAIGEGRDGNGRLQRAIEKLTGVMRQYCPNASVIIRSKHSPDDSRYPVVELKALDLGDTANYVKLCGAGAALVAAQGEYIQKIFQHTDGIPARIDLALRHVQTLGPAVLMALSTDIAGKQAVIPKSEDGLAMTMAEFFRSKDPSLSRASKLLVALSMFPKGEQLLTVKRFHENSPFYDSDAITLSERGFVHSVDVIDIGHTDYSDRGRAIVVKRSVRDFIYGALNAAELARLNTRALEIYFGSNWRQGEIKGKRALHAESNQCLDWQVANANIMLVRAIRQAINEGDGLALKHGIALVVAHCSWLRSGDNYRSLRTLCEEILPLLSSEAGDGLSLIPLRMHFARALRMTGRWREAANNFKDVIPQLLTTRDKSSAYLNLALSLSGDEDDEALAAAKECIRVDPKHSNALQARTLILQATSESGAELEKKLWKTERAARKRKLHIVANNLALKRVAGEGDPGKKRSLLQEVIKFGVQDGDYLNVMRAQVALGKLVLSEKGSLEGGDLIGPIAAFHYFYSEEMGSNLDRSHQLLWDAFQAAGDTDNLLRLFRHSSILWRLRGREELEERFLRQLGPVVVKDRRDITSLPQREFLYYKARSESLQPMLAGRGQKGGEG